MSKTNLYEIRANYNQNTIVMYQAYNDQIADLALKSQKFEKPFSFQRMTWIKPSFLWLMHRSQWGKKSNQTRILGVHVLRKTFDEALSMGVLTSPEVGGNKNNDWEKRFSEAKVHVQWDTERGLRGEALDHYSIQVGLSRHIIKEYNEDWIQKIEDLTPLVKKMTALKKDGQKNLKKLLPPERKYTPSNSESLKHLYL